MNEEELYEKQYGEKIIKNANSFPLLRKIFKSLDLHREDLAVSFLEKGDTFLDVGSGDGSLIFKVHDKFKEIYGIDISPSRVEEAKIRAEQKFGVENKMHFSFCNISEKADFPDATFDAITSIAVIEHVFDPYFVVSEINRILKPGGVFVVQVPNIAYLRHRIHLLMGKLPVTSSPFNWKEIGWDGGHLHYFTRDALCDMLEECSFRILNVSGSGLLAKFRNFYPALLTGDICVKAQKADV